ncbi:MAG: AAA family ATPase [Nanoarchaeota archaeon]
MEENYSLKNSSGYREDPLYSLSFENSKLEEENKNLKRTVQFYQKELEKYRNPPFIVSEVLSLTKENKAIVRLPNQSNFMVDISDNCNFKIKPGDMVLNEQKSLVIMDKVELTKNFPVENYLIINKNIDVSWKNIGGLKKEVERVKEVLELPLIKPEVFKKMGITPPKGVLLYGPPGTGKTMMAKALAKETNATFIELVGSELVQKFIGEGAKLVKDLFELARKRAPTIIFIDEIDSIAARRIETGTSGEREVQRTFMQLLGEIDGFSPLDNVKIIAATNRMDILDEAVMRPGRLERHIEIDMPSQEDRFEILKIHTKNMRLDQDVDLEEISILTKEFSGAKLKALTTEAGYIAIKQNNKKIFQKDFIKAVEIIKEEDENYEVLSHSYS